MIKLSVVILTKNEEKNILDCLENLEGVSEVIIIDDNSTDLTIEVIKSLNRKNIKIFKRQLDLNFAKQRNFGLEKAKNEWVLFIDADERASKEFLSEISEQITNTTLNSFYVKRKDVLWGKVLNHGETGSMKLVRLGKKNAGKWRGEVHEVWKTQGNVGSLNIALMHYPHQRLKEFISEINFYTTIRAEELFKTKKEISIWEILFYPKAKFFKNYIIRLGFLDGIAGLVVAVMMSLHSFLVRAKLWQLTRK